MFLDGVDAALAVCVNCDVGCDRDGSEGAVYGSKFCRMIIRECDCPVVALHAPEFFCMDVVFH